MADVLSRAFLDSECATTSPTEEEAALHVDLMVHGITVSEAKWDKIASATSADHVVQNVVMNIQNEWTQ